MPTFAFDVTQKRTQTRTVRVYVEAPIFSTALDNAYAQLWKSTAETVLKPWATVLQDDSSLVTPVHSAQLTLLDRFKKHLLSLKDVPTSMETLDHLHDEYGLTTDGKGFTGLAERFSQLFPHIQEEVIADLEYDPDAK